MKTAAETFPPTSARSWFANDREQLTIDTYDTDVRQPRAAADLRLVQLGQELARQSREQETADAWCRRLDRLSIGFAKWIAAPGLLLLVAIQIAKALSRHWGLG